MVKNMFRNIKLTWLALTWFLPLAKTEGDAQMRFCRRVEKMLDEKIIYPDLHTRILPLAWLRYSPRNKAYVLYMPRPNNWLGMKRKFGVGLNPEKRQDNF